MENIRLNNIYNLDCMQGLEKMSDEDFIDLTITSPPYNLNIQYDSYNDDLDFNTYVENMFQTFKKLYDKTAESGRVCVVVPSDIGKLSKDSKISLDVVFHNLLIDVGFKFRAKIIWNKNQITSRTAWGSFQSPSNPNLLSPFEYVLVFYKGSSKKIGNSEHITISKEEFIEWSNCVWNISPASKKKLEHPAPFPEELCRRLIRLFTYKNDIVCDLFSGLGTTCVVAKKENRRYIGFEISKNYTEKSKIRIEEID